MKSNEWIIRTQRRQQSTAVEDSGGAQRQICLRDVCNFVVGLLIAWLIVGR